MYINIYDPMMSAELVFCVFIFAFFHRRFDNFELKRCTGSVFGLILTYIVTTGYTIHHIFLIVSSLFLIKIIGWRKCHVYVTGYVLCYISIFRIVYTNICYNRNVELCLYQMLCSLKLVGLAFDIHLTNRKKDKYDILNKYEEPLNPSFVDMLHYMFTYVGMLFGPYTRYRTHDDFNRLPFAKQTNCLKLLYKRFPMMCICMYFTLWINQYFPIEYIITDEFRKSHFLYKNLLNFLYFLRFKLWMCNGFYIGQCLCAILGYGLYPEELKSVCTHGPTKEYNHLKNISDEEAEKLNYDLETVNTINFVKIHTAPWHSDFWRNWNLTVQYCMGRYIYKELLGNRVHKDSRILLTMFFSALWHGVEIGYYTSLVLCGVYMISEKPYKKIYQYTTGWVSVAFLVVMWLIQTHIVSYMMVSFIILDPMAIHIHAAAMNYVPYISLVFFYLIGKLALIFIKKDT